MFTKEELEYLYLSMEDYLIYLKRTESEYHELLGYDGGMGKHVLKAYEFRDKVSKILSEYK